MKSEIDPNAVAGWILEENTDIPGRIVVFVVGGR